MSKPYAEMLSLSNASRAKPRDIRGFMHVVADCFSPLDVILRKCRLSLTKACRRRIYAFRNRTVSFSTGLGRHSFSCATKLRLPIPCASALAREEFSYPRLTQPQSFPGSASLVIHADFIPRNRAGLNGTLRCHPKEAQALARERLPTKDLSIICRTPTRHELLLALDVILSVGPVLRSKTELSE